MLKVWRLMWSNEDRGELEPRTPYVMGVLAVTAIVMGSLMSFGYV